MNIFVVFEISGDNIENIKPILRNLGYYDYWISNELRYDLPNNCMWKQNSSLENGKTEVENAIGTRFLANNNIRLEKLIVLQATPWTGKATVSL
ncbi:MAG: hypothetical protein HY959_04240 [Ignavibacteriae bacterium]|nr:hypothetical protein [Ignavibacteriota bacterium]